MTTDEYNAPRRASGPSEHEIRRQTRANLWKRIAIGALVAALVLILGGMTYTVTAIRDQQVANAPLTKSAASAAEQAKLGTERIEECTTPTRHCFEQGQKRLAVLVSSLNQVTIRAASAAASCAAASPNQTYAEILQCVTDSLGDLAAKAPNKASARPSSTTSAAGKSTKARKGTKGVTAPAPTHTASPEPKPGPDPSPTPIPTPTPTPVATCVLTICIPPLHLLG